MRTYKWSWRKAYLSIQMYVFIYLIAEIYMNKYLAFSFLVTAKDLWRRFGRCKGNNGVTSKSNDTGIYTVSPSASSRQKGQSTAGNAGRCQFVFFCPFGARASRHQPAGMDGSTEEKRAEPAYLSICSTSSKRKRGNQMSKALSCLKPATVRHFPRSIN